MTFLNHYTYLFSIPEKQADKVSGILRLAQARPIETLQNERINKQLNAFLKTYKFEKLITNYKKMQSFIPNNSLNGNKTNSSTNKLYATSLNVFPENPPLMVRKAVSDEADKFSKFTYSKVQVVTNNLNNGMNSKEFIKANNLKPSLRAAESLVLNHLTYNKFKENLYFKTNNIQPTKSKSTSLFFLNILSNSKPRTCSDFLSSPKIRKTWFRNTAWSLQTQQHRSSNGINLSLQLPYALGPSVPAGASGQNMYELPVAQSSSRFGTYYFLQKLLSKYLDVWNASADNGSVLSNSENIKLNFSMVSLLDSKMAIQTPNSLYFVFTQLNQKTFLSYWLLPVAGLALLTPTLLTLTGQSVSVQKFNSFINKKTDMMVLSNTEMPSKSFGTPTLFGTSVEIYLPNSYMPKGEGESGINRVNSSINAVKKNTVTANLVLDSESQEVATSFQNDLISIKYCFNNLYNYISNKTALSTKNLFLFSAIKSNATKHKRTQSFFSVENTTTLGNNSNFVKGHFKSSINAFSSYLPSTNVHSMIPLTSLPYLKAISPLYSKFMIDHSLKFITPKTTLKLLQHKLNKSPKQMYTKTQNFTGLRDLRALNSFSFGQVNFRTNHFLHSNSRPLNHYNQALKLINGYEQYKNNLQINCNKTLDLNTKNKLVYQVNKSHLFNQKCSQIVYKQSLYNRDLCTIRGTGTKVVDYFSHGDKLSNKNGIVLDYFVYSNLLFDNKTNTIINKDGKQNITKLKLNLTKTTVPFKTLIKKYTSINSLVANEQTRNNLNLGLIHFNGHLSVVSNANLLTGRPVKFIYYKFDKRLNSYLIYVNQNLKKFIQLNNNFLKPKPLSHQKNKPVEDFNQYATNNSSPPKTNVFEKSFVEDSSLRKPLTSLRGSKQFLNSLTILFKHQKMFKKKTLKAHKWHSDTQGIFRKHTNSSFGSANFSNGPEESSLSTRLHIQKKRKAKKQRLETRRQKKRTRFFPRPVWLRSRMFLNFLTERNKYYLNSTITKQGFSLPSKDVVTTKLDWLKEDMRRLPLGAYQYKSLLTQKAGNKFQRQSFTEVVSTMEYINGIHKALNNSIFNKIVRKSLLSSSQNPLKLRLVANYSKMQFMHRVKLPFYRTLKHSEGTKNLANKKQNLRDIKIKANYNNFKSQKANNQPQQNDKDKDKDTMFRDFWVWSYNNTQTNAFNQNLWWLLPNLTTKQSNLEFLTSTYPTAKETQRAKEEIHGNSIPTASKNQIALIRLNWALNKTNINTFTDYSKRNNLWTTQKLRNQSKNNKTKSLEKQFITNWEKFFLNKNLNIFSKKIISKVKQKKQKLNYMTSYLNVQSEHNVKIFHNSWWTHLNIKNLVNNQDMVIPVREGYFSVGNFNSEFINSAIIKSINNKTLVENYVYSPSSEKETMQLLLMSSSILLHLCAIISLVSISQVRCFVKFHLILLYKLSNVYNAILNQLSNKLQKNLPIYNNINKLNSRYFYMNHQKSQIKQRKKLLTYFSLTLLKKQFVTVKPLQIRNFASIKNQSSNNSNLTYTDMLPLSLRANKFRGSKYDISIREEEGQSAHIKPSKSMYAKLNILSLKTIFLKQLLMNKKPSALPSNVGLKSNRETQKSQLIQRIKTKELQISLKKNIIGFSKVTKNHILKILFNVIEVFQTAVRNISSFFEKPAEFTTTWIAYGFLVEWSSDFITIIPENVDIYIWNVFSKIYRTIPLSFISTTLGPASTVFDPVTNSTIPIQMGNFNYQKMVAFPILLSLSHLLHRRILYLFDTLFSTITQPDTDLIARQEKGTLFWDIWADFLVTAADYYNVNVAALSTIKAEQNSLIENISNDFDNLTMSSKKPFFMPNKGVSNIKNIFWIKKLKEPQLPESIVQNREVFVRERKRTLKGLFNIYAPQEETLWNNPTSPKNLSDEKISFKLFNQLNLQLFAEKNKIKPYFEAYFSTTQQKTNIMQSAFPEANLNRWSVNQFITYQSWHSHNGSNNSNGDLFIDYHPPKTFSHIPALKYNSILQQPIGSLVCQIYSGLFNKQISKNILLVNPKTTSNNLVDYNVLLIQALAGETEMKIITDNAQRYALVNRGFAIGIKLLREVFDAIALNTPCIFLLEDIHAIGERRPMLISDFGGGMSDDNGSFKEDFFGSQRDEVHEKNQVVYQLTRHAITHYKKPFKGDYSLAIPTNLYVTDLFLKLPTQSISNLTNVENHNLSIKNKIQHNGTQSLTETKRNLGGDINKNSYLQLTQFTKTLAPPSTSPFSVLLLKEEKRLKPNKIVEELPWTSLPGEQLATKPRTSYSVRAKVAMLAELSLSNLSAKLDMITDLLVIIDSVRSNKGFVVFATTDIPHVLDPALRRPGRLDETICLPNIHTSNILNFTKNYEIFKSAKDTSNFGKKIILNEMQNLTTTSTQRDMYLSCLPTNNQTHKTKREGVLTMNLKDYNILLNQVYFAEGTGGILNSQMHKDSLQKSLNFALISHSKKLKELNVSKLIGSNGTVSQGNVDQLGVFAGQIVNKQKKSLQQHLPNSKKSFKKKYKDKAIIYYEVGKFVLNYFLNNQLTQSSIIDKPVSVTNKQTNDITIFGNDFLNLKTINYLSLYNSKNKILLQLMLIFGGKISQLLSSKNLVKSLKQASINSYMVEEESGSISSAGMPLGQTHLLPKALSVLAKPMIFSDGYNNQNLKTATTLLLSFIHKRYLYRKNLIVPKLLSFADGNILDEPPSPPFSSLLIPAKRFENYKRFFRDTLTGDKMGQRKSQITLLEKLQYHMQLRSIKQLNATFSSQENLDFQSNAALTSQKLDTLMSLSTNNLLQNPTNINWYYQNRILKRHGQYLTNQWWNGQLSEHNAETVFLSDIDWRSSFIKNKNINITKSKNLYRLTQQKNNTDGLDVLLDFPDTDQYYNPKRRRWLLNNGSWNFWFNFDKLYSEEIVTTWILESLIQTYKYLHKNTELLDFVTNKFITLGYIAPENANLQNISGFPSQSELLSTKEIILTNSFKRF
uniref:Cell division protein n=1 Tax=Chlamydomonas reinhardtii TaxID=3055 RepID=A0A218N8A7_CHLRE|nr:hypothetical protein [Chlamydomonas reinhardtii]ASF83363.1 hypothetical protein [Chlamydomonas reinhardtii]ASF83430.1 hypothetical protein [Chlamydomonas reinhardtii]ASF83497.1 hypothetical protein [Chlamydomonas reinhardtii]ASF83561.1 hypothetical protein [Chlamydomonas reinhardtii]